MYTPHSDKHQDAIVKNSATTLKTHDQIEQERNTMRPVIILQYDIKPTKNENGVSYYGTHEVGIGVFHCWGTNYEECQENFGNFTTAIIEKPGGEILNYPAEMIRFTDKNQ